MTMPQFLIMFFLLMLMMSTGAPAAVDCDMARQMSAGMTAQQRASAGTRAQRSEYAHCFKSQTKKKVRRRKRG
jgi:hypothetical protein